LPALEQCGGAWVLGMLFQKKARRTHAWSGFLGDTWLVRGARVAGMPALLRVRGEDLERGVVPPPVLFYPASGSLTNLNTAEDFRNFDKKDLLNSLGADITKDIHSGRIEQDPSLLVKFHVLSYADLKNHKFLYWFCFPAMDAFGEFEIEPVVDSSIPDHQAPFFGVSCDGTVLSLAEMMLVSHDTIKCLAYHDPGSLPNQPSSCILNFLYWASIRLPGVHSVLCIRKENSFLVVRVNETKKPGKWIGFEPNLKGQMGPRLMDLSSQLDPHKLANAASDLNLKLMRWRQLPELDTVLLGSTKCLLIGSGTLGCSVARCMLGWGIRNITMLDNGTVSYSNPARQSLFSFQDCLDGGKPKAQAAAKALQEILPGINAKGVHLSIPMPGHFITEDTKDDVARLQTLIQEHDVVVLLTDTRESRWLPTMLSTKYDKLVLNSALGFDSFMVMRHGPLKQQQRLGCYFCNDVVAPQNSMKDRTLDQQCTVTRPGLAPIAGAILVELLVGLLHHPLGNAAPFSSSLEETNPEGGIQKLGLLPHQIRGFLPAFQMTNVSGQAYPQCTACSMCVMEKYETDGYDMLVETFKNPTYLEDLTGLTALRQKSQDYLDEDDDDF